MKLVLINLYDFVDLQKNSTPLGILSLGTIIKDDPGIQGKVIDFHRIYENNILNKSEILSENIQNCYQYIMQHTPDIIGMYTMHNTLHIAILLAQEFKRKNPEIKVMLGGPQASLCAEEIVTKIDAIDAIGIGEAEYTIIPNLWALKTGCYDDAVGICYREDGKVKYIENKNLIPNLEELPFIDYDLLGFPVEKHMSIDVGRGCSFSCSFCSTKNFWKRKFRVKLAQRIFDEVKLYHDSYGIRSFSFQHDLFVANRSLIFELCKLIKESSLKIDWWCSSRIDTIDEELIDEMASAGCAGIYFGIETGSQRMQRIINKNLKLDQLDSLIEVLKRYNVKPTFSFIYGFPEENEEDLNETLDMLYRLYNSFKVRHKKRMVELQLHKLIFLSATELTDKYIGKLEKTEDYHTDASLSLSIWSDSYLNELIQDKSIFPHLFDYKTDIRHDFKYLDLAFNTIFMNSIDYYEGTYRLLLNYFGKNHVKVFHAFRTIITEKEIKACYHYYHNNLAMFLETVFSVIRKFVNNYDFGSSSTGIKEMFEFEMFTYEFVKPKPESQKGSNYTLSYEHDVFEAKKYCLDVLAKRHTNVQYKWNDGKVLVNKI